MQTGTSSAADTIVLTVDTTLTAINNSAYGDNGLPLIESAITITGNGHTIKRDPADPDRFRLIAINSTGNLTIQDTTLSGGFAYAGSQQENSGGGIANLSGQLRLEGCTVSGNSAHHVGGGIYSHADGSDVVSLLNSTISGNSARREGGGMWSRTDSTSTLGISTSTVSGNTAYSGGGVYSRTFDSSTASILDSTITSNRTGTLGGGIDSITHGSSTQNLVNSTVSANSAGIRGGGVYSRTNGSNDALNILNSTITGNRADRDGGGIYNRNSGYGTLSIRNSTITGNGAGLKGGGIYSLRSEGLVRILDSIIASNGAYSGGGVFGLTLNVSTLSILNSTISGNIASHQGGGVFSWTYSGTQSVINSTISGNSASLQGGGMFSRTRYPGTQSIVNSTISGNIANLDGGGTFSVIDGGTATLHRSLIAGNIALRNGDEICNYQSRSGFLVDDYNLFGHSGVSTADALDGLSVGATDLLATSDSATPTALTAILDTTLADNGGPTLTHALVTDSPAIDAAGVCGVPTDQRGFVRNVGDCDIGAYEFGASPNPPEVCGNCLDDDGDNKIDVADEDCAAVPLNSERGAFGFKPDPGKDQLSLNAIFPLGPVFDPPTEGATVQFFDAAGQLACIHIPAGPVVRKPPGWKVKTGRTGTTWSFSDARDGSLGDPTKDRLSVQCNTQQQECTVKLNVKAANIAGDATARNITTGVIIGDDSWKKEQGWQPKAKGKKLVTREE